MFEQPETRDIPQDQYEFLKKEIARWQEDRILDPGVGAEILSKYSVRPKTLLALKILGLVGAGTAGAGVLLFIAANWHSEAIATKALIAVALMILFYIAGSVLRRKPTLYESVGEPCVLLGNLVFGALIILACQHYHISALPPMELLIWGVASSLVACAFRSSACAVIACAGFGVYAVSATEITPYAVGAAACAFACAYFVKSPYALGLVLTMCGLKLYYSLNYGNSNPFDGAALPTFGAVCFLGHLWHLASLRMRSLHVPYLVVGTGALIFGLLTQIHAYYGSDSKSAGLLWWSSMIFVVALMAAGITMRKQRSFPRVFAGFIYICGVLPVLTVGTDFRMMAVQAAFAVVALSFIIYAIAWLEQPIYSVIPILAAVCYFIGYSSTLSAKALEHSIVFAGFGTVTLLVVLLVSLRWRRKTRLSTLTGSHASISGQ